MVYSTQHIDLLAAGEALCIGFVSLGRRKIRKAMLFFLAAREEIVMFREMRRKKQALSTEESLAILNRGISGVLAVTGDQGYPYAVPLSYVYDNNKIFFHCALSGHKLDAIAANNKVSFCVVGQDRVMPQEYTTYFRSVIILSLIHI